MHAQYSHAAVNYFHTVICHNIRDGSAAARVYPAQLGKLICRPVLIQSSADFSQIFCIGIIRTALSTASGKFIKYQPL